MKSNKTLLTTLLSLGLLASAGAAQARVGASRANR